MEDLLIAARSVRDLAYAPYSRYKVGAALRTTDGRTFAGCNVENISYGLTLCAERGAVMAMAAAGAREIIEIAIATEDGGTPCGACRQVLAEFRPKSGCLTVHLAASDGSVRTTTLDALLPQSFESTAVARTE